MTKYHTTRREARDKLGQAHGMMLGASERLTLVAYWYKDAHPEITASINQIVEHLEVLSDLVSSLGANL